MFYKGNSVTWLGPLGPLGSGSYLSVSVERGFRELEDILNLKALNKIDRVNLLNIVLFKLCIRG